MIGIEIPTLGDVTGRDFCISSRNRKRSQAEKTIEGVYLTSQMVKKFSYMQVYYHTLQLLARQSSSTAAVYHRHSPITWEESNPTYTAPLLLHPSRYSDH